MTGMCAGREAVRLPVHACVVATRQAVMVVHMVVWVRYGHRGQPIEHFSPGQRFGAENAASRRSGRRSRSELNCAAADL